MSLSMDGVSSYLNTQASSAMSGSAADKIKNSVSGISKDSTDEELKEAVETFEAYFLEKVIKEVKESAKSINPDKEEDSNSQITDFYMDSTIQDLATTMVKEYGGTLTDDLVAQMKRNYGISSTEENISE